MGAFQDLGKALRWLRTRQDRKQYEIAEEAGITKAMLSAYETGKQNPSIETLEKILGALNVDLLALHKALQVNDSGADGGAAETRSWASFPRPTPSRGYAVAEPRTNIYHVLDIDHPLPADQELAFSQMLAGYHSLLRHMYQQLRQREQVAGAFGNGGDGDGDGGNENGGLS